MDTQIIMDIYKATPTNAYDRELFDSYDGNSLLYLSGIDPMDAELGDIYTEVVSCQELLTSCMNLLLAADVLLCLLLGCLMASIFSRFWRISR